MQQGLETEGLAVVFVLHAVAGKYFNGSGCGSCLLNGKGWRAVKAVGGSSEEQQL